MNQRELRAGAYVERCPRASHARALCGWLRGLAPWPPSFGRRTRRSPRLRAGVPVARGPTGACFVSKYSSCNTVSRGKVVLKLINPKLKF